MILFCYNSLIYQFFETVILIPLEYILNFYKSGKRTELFAKSFLFTDHHTVLSLLLWLGAKCKYPL